MLLETEDNQEILSPPPSFGKDEMNFAEFPIALLTDRAPKGQRSIKFKDQVYDEKRKKLITRKRVIEGSEEYGLPTATDDTVVLALIQLTKLKSDFTQREVEFTRLELIHMLGWPNEGKSYDRLKLSLLRIKAVNYIYDNAWWDARQKKWTTRAFNIIDNVEINDSRATNGQSGLFPSRIVWNEVVFDSFQTGFLRNIDFQLCMRLEHPTALRMYRFLGKRFYIKSDWTFELKDFAYEHIGLGRNYEGGTQIARKLQPAIDELESVGFLEPLTDEQRFLKKGRDWSIRLVRKSPDLPTPHNIPLAEASPLIKELTERGVSEKTSMQLVQRHLAEFIQLKIDVFDWLVEQKDKKVTQNPAGYLVKSISDDYASPKGFVSKAEQQRRQEAKQVKEREAAEERRRQQEHAARERAQSMAVAAYRKALTPDQLTQLEAEAIAIASEETQRNLDDPTLKPFRKTLISRLVDEHIARLIDAGEKLSEPA